MTKNKSNKWFGQMANKAYNRTVQQFQNIPTHPDNFRNTWSKLYQFREIQKKYIASERLLKCLSEWVLKGTIN